MPRCGSNSSIRAAGCSAVHDREASRIAPSPRPLPTYLQPTPAPAHVHRPAPSHAVTHMIAMQGAPGAHGEHASPHAFPAHGS
jgi:hypothetical protein